MPQLSVYTCPATTPASEIVATLPDSFVMSLSQPSDVTVIDGATDWALEAIAALPLSRAIVIFDPHEVKAARLDVLIDAAIDLAIPIVLAEPFAGAPGLGSTLPVVQEGYDDAQCVTAFAITDAQPAHALLSQIRALRVLGFSEPKLTVEHTPHGLTVSGTVGRGDRAVDFISLVSVSAALQPHQRIHALGPNRMVDATVWGAKTARPARISITAHDGVIELPPVYETAYRAALRQLRSLAEEGHETHMRSLQTFRDDMRAVYPDEESWT